MAKRRTGRRKRPVAPSPRRPGAGALGPGEFESVDLPTEVPPTEQEGELEEAELTQAAWGVAAPSQKLHAAREQLEERLLVGVTEQALAAEAGTDGHGFENIVGVGIAEKLVDGSFTGEPAVTVYVIAKAPRHTVTEQALVPREVNGVPTDVVAIGELNAFPFKGRYRPAPAGVSVGHFQITAGTIACLVRRAQSLFILSNNHVLANSNAGKLGDPILQPGPFDGGKVPTDVIAKLSQFIPIKFGGAINLVDCAIAQTSPKLVTPLNKVFGKISAAPAPCAINMLVKKCGRTTQFTRGRIVDCNATVRVGYGTAGVALFRHQIIIVSLTTAAFSQGGDSGSLIVTNAGNRPVGLLFAGSPSHTIANPIAAVLQALNVSIVV